MMQLAIAMWFEATWMQTMTEVGAPEYALTNEAYRRYYVEDMLDVWMETRHSTHYKRQRKPARVLA